MGDITSELRDNALELRELRAGGLSRIAEASALLSHVRSESLRAAGTVTTDINAYNNAVYNARADLALDLLQLLTSRKGSAEHHRAVFKLMDMAQGASDERRRIEGGEKR